MSDDLTDPNGQLAADDPLLSPETFYDEGGVRVRYVPTKTMFAVGLTVDGGDEALLSGGEVDLILDDPDEWDAWRQRTGERTEIPLDTFDAPEVCEALDRAARTARFAVFADIAGRDAVDAFKNGDMSATEFKDEFVGGVDRALDERDGGGSA